MLPTAKYVNGVLIALVDIVTGQLICFPSEQVGYEGDPIVIGVASSNVKKGEEIKDEKLWK